MKLRIQDSSVRLRITLKELETLQQKAVLEKVCLIPVGASFRYLVRVRDALAESRVVAQPYSLALELSTEDLRTLENPESEGVYLRKEWTDNQGVARRFMAFIEKDRPASTCRKIEAWIYEGHNGGENVLVAKPGKRQ